MKLISDSAQGYGSTLNGQHPLEWVDVQTTSFFPAKPLGCYGDGGAVLTNDADLHNILLSLRFHGRGEDYSDTARIGLNSRLDTMQAAILLAKLSVFADEIDRRNVIADRYAEGLGNHKIGLPAVMAGVRSTWAQYTIEVEDPTSFCAAMKGEGVPTARYYPRPIHQHTAYTNYPIGQGGLAATEASRDRVVSLPMHAYLEPSDQDRIIAAAIKAAA